MTDLEKIHKIAERVRKEVVGDYSSEGLCKECSKQICEELKAAGIEGATMLHGTVGYHPHWWVRLGNTLIDVTGDQFDGNNIPPILVVPWDGWDGLYVED